MASGAAPGAPAPNATVYVSNLEERIKIPELIDSLRELFSEYGNIIDVVAKKNLKAKGQAFIVFDEVESASKAIEEIQGFELFGKEMKLGYARTRSDAFVKLVEGEQGLEGWRRKRVAEKDKKTALLQAEEQKRLKRAAASNPASAQASDLNPRPAKTTRGAGLKSTNASAAAVIPDEYLPPNKILFVQNLPDGYDIDSLTAIFGRFEGFREVRLVPGRKGIAFVEYEAETGAITAKENTAGLAVGAEGQVIKVTYQRQ